MEFWCRQMKYHLVPWNSMEVWDRHFMAFYPGWTSKGYSMEFHGTLDSPNKKSPSSMGFHGIRKAPLQMTQVFHGIPWNIPWNSMELWCHQMTYHLVPWNSMEHSMEFHGTLVSPYEVSLSSMEFHGTLRLPFYNILPWLDFHRIFHGIPWTLELSNKKSWNSTEHSMEFHGILVPPNEVSLSSMEFHGSLRSPFYGILPWLNFQGIFHGIPWNSGLAK